MEVVIRYRGPGSAVEVLAQALRDEGLEVEYEPPPEYRSFPEPLVWVAVYVALKMADAALEVPQEELKASIRRALAKYRKRGGPGEVEGPPD